VLSPAMMLLDAADMISLFDNHIYADIYVIWRVQKATLRDDTTLLPQTMMNERWLMRYYADSRWSDERDDVMPILCCYHV